MVRDRGLLDSDQLMRSGVRGPYQELYGVEIFGRMPVTTMRLWFFSARRFPKTIWSPTIGAADRRQGRQTRQVADRGERGPLPDAY